MTQARGVNLSEVIAYHTLKGVANRTLGFQIRRSLYLLVPEVGEEITLEYAT